MQLRNSDSERHSSEEFSDLIGVWKLSSVSEKHIKNYVGQIPLDIELIIRSSNVAQAINVPYVRLSSSKKIIFWNGDCSWNLTGKRNAWTIDLQMNNASTEWYVSKKNGEYILVQPIYTMDELEVIVLTKEK